MPATAAADMYQPGAAGLPLQRVRTVSSDWATAAIWPRVSGGRDIGSPSISPPDLQRRCNESG